MKHNLPSPSSLGKVYGVAQDRAEAGLLPCSLLSYCEPCFLFPLDTYWLQRGCQCPNRECAGCWKHQAGQEVLSRLRASHRYFNSLVSDSSVQSVHALEAWVPCRPPFSLCCFSAFFPPELFAVVFCVLLVSCKDLVGYIFTTDR